MKFYKYYIPFLTIVTDIIHTSYASNDFSIMYNENGGWKKSWTGNEHNQLKAYGKDPKQYEGENWPMTAFLKRTIDLFERQAMNTRTNARRIRIYNTRRSYSLAVNKKGRLYTTKSFNAPEAIFKVHLFGLEKNKSLVKLQSEAYGKYLAISCKTGHVYTTKKKLNQEALFYYNHQNNDADFQSKKCSKNSNRWYLGIKKDGRIKNAKGASSSDFGTKFLIIHYKR